MARILAFVPDLLFGSNVLGALRAAGHEPALISDAETLRREAPGADALVVDLTAEAAERIEAVSRAQTGLPVLAFYAHVETEVRERAQQAGFELVVPRSRMAREGAALIDRLLSR
jgi:CheY-like chemotaxis protein